MNSQTSLNLALDLYSEHLAPIPILAGSKRAAIRWRQFQHTGPSANQLREMFDCDNLTVGVVTGEPSDNLLVLDCDSVQARDEWLERLNDPQTWVVGTSRGAHVYLRTPVAVRSARLDDTDLRGQGAYVLAPGAIHPSGLLYEFMRRTPEILRLPALNSVPGLPLQAAPTRPSGVPRKAWAMLTYEDTSARKDYSRREYSAICVLVNVEWDYGRVLGLFDRYARLDGHYMRRKVERGEKAAHEWLEDEYRKAHAFVTSNESKEQQIARQLQGIAENRAWSGRAGAYDRAVYFAHLQIAQTSNKLIYAASVRDLAERAGISKEAAGTANKRLVSFGLLRVEKQSVGTLANLWRLDSSFTSESQGSTQNLDTHIHIGSTECIGFAGQDCFRWNALGKTGAEVWGVFQDGEPHNVHEIVGRTGRDRRTIEKKLGRMYALEMVEPDVTEGGLVWSAVKDVDLDRIAQMLGVQGAGERQRVRHRRERELYRSAFERGQER